MHPLMRLTAITLDCADPEALAAFYRRPTGFEPHPESDADFAGLTRGQRWRVFTDPAGHRFCVTGR